MLTAEAHIFFLILHITVAVAACVCREFALPTNSRPAAATPIKTLGQRLSHRRRWAGVLLSCRIVGEVVSLMLSLTHACTKIDVEAF